MPYLICLSPPAVTACSPSAVVVTQYSVPYDCWCPAYFEATSPLAASPAAAEAGPGPTLRKTTDLSEDVETSPSAVGPGAHMSVTCQPSNEEEHT